MNTHSLKSTSKVKEVPKANSIEIGQMKISKKEVKKLEIFGQLNKKTNRYREIGRDACRSTLRG